MFEMETASIVKLFVCLFFVIDIDSLQVDVILH